MKTRNIFLVAVLISVIGLSALTTEADYNKRVAPRERLELDLSCNVLGIPVQNEMLSNLGLDGEKYDFAKMYTIEYNEYRVKLYNDIVRYKHLINGPQNMVNSSMIDHYEMQIDRTYMMIQDNWKSYNLKMASLLQRDQIERWYQMVNQYCGVE